MHVSNEGLRHHRSLGWAEFEIVLSELWQCLDRTRSAIDLDFVNVILADESAGVDVVEYRRHDSRLFVVDDQCGLRFFSEARCHASFQEC